MQTSHAHSRNSNPDWLHLEPTLFFLESEREPFHFNIFTIFYHLYHLLPSFTIFYLESSNWLASRPPDVQIPRLTSGINEALTYWAQEFTVWTSLDCGDEEWDTKFDQSHNESVKVKFVSLQAPHSFTLHKSTLWSTKCIQMQCSDTNESGFVKQFASSSSFVSYLSNTNTTQRYIFGDIDKYSWILCSQVLNTSWIHMNTYEPAYMNIYEGSSAFLITFRLQVLLLSSQLEAITNLKRLKQQRQKKSLVRLAQSHFWVDDHIKEARVKSLQNRERERDSFSKSFRTSCKGKVQPHCPGTVLKTKWTTWNSQRHLTANETDDALDGSDLRRPQTTQSPSHILVTSRLIFFAASRSNVRFASNAKKCCDSKAFWLL